MPLDEILHHVEERALAAEHHKLAKSAGK